MVSHLSLRSSVTNTPKLTCVSSPICLEALQHHPPGSSVTHPGGVVVASHPQGHSSTRSGAGVGPSSNHEESTLGREVTSDMREKRGSDATAVAENGGILRLKTCSHVFHARCLASWYIRLMYACPICRCRYWSSPEDNRSRRSSGNSATRGGTIPSTSTMHPMDRVVII